MALDAPHIGFVIRETPDKIVVFGEKNERYDIPISEIQHVSKNVSIGLNFSDIAKKYKVDRNGHSQPANMQTLGEIEKTSISRRMKVNTKDPYSIRVLG